MPVTDLLDGNPLSVDPSRRAFEAHHNSILRADLVHLRETGDGSKSLKHPARRLECRPIKSEEILVQIAPQGNVAIAQFAEIQIVIVVPVPSQRPVSRRAAAVNAGERKRLQRIRDCQIRLLEITGDPEYIYQVACFDLPDVTCP